MLCGEKRRKKFQYLLCSDKNKIYRFQAIFIMHIRIFQKINIREIKMAFL